MSTRAMRTVLQAAVLLLLAPPLHAQGGEEPTRSHRHLAVGNVAFLNTLEPALHVGYLYQGSLGRSGISVDEFGTPTVRPPRWFAHTLLSAGWAWQADERGEPGVAALGQLGLLYRLENDGPLGISMLGVAGQGSYGPRGIGAVGRAELLHGNAALSVGWMKLEHRDDGVVVAVDLLRCILQDLGLVSRCII